MHFFHKDCETDIGNDFTQTYSAAQKKVLGSIKSHF